jgi:roadblock/LC7 domain-containing protein
VSALDELVSLDGVLMAGRFGPDWQIAEHKDSSLFYVQAIDVMGPFCAAIQMMFNTLGVAMRAFTSANWLPVHGWTVAGGDYSITLKGDRFALFETAKVESVDELRRLLGGEMS